MSLRELKPSRVMRVIVCFLALSVASAAIHFPFRESVYIRGPVGALGLMCAWFGFGIVVWSITRIRQRGLWQVFLFSIAVLGYWTWQLYEAVLGRYN
jgi:hypothetical protein